MKLKKLLLLLLCLPLGASAQLSATDAKSKELERFKSSKTYAVLTGNKAFDAQLKAVLPEVWKVTPVEFIGGKEFETKITDESASFLILSNIETGSGKSYHYFALINGGKKKLSKYEYDDMIAYCPLNYFQDERNLVESAFRLRNMAQGMQLAIETIEKNGLKGSSFGLVKEIGKIYSQKAPEIAKRTLLINKNQMDKGAQEEFAKSYKGKVEFCDQAKIAKAIADKSTEFYYFQAAVTLNKSMFVIDPSNGAVLYFDYAMMGLAINKKDAKALIEAIQGEK